MAGGRCGFALRTFLGALAARFGISAGGIRRGSGAYASGSSPSSVRFAVSNHWKMLTLKSSIAAHPTTSRCGPASSTARWCADKGHQIAPVDPLSSGGAFCMMGLRGDRLEAAGIALSVREVAGLAQVQEPERAGGAARGGEGLALMGRQPAPRVSSERLDPPVPRCGPTRQRLGLGNPTSHDASHGRPTAPTRARCAR